MPQQLKHEIDTGFGVLTREGDTVFYRTREKMVLDLDTAKIIVTERKKLSGKDDVYLILNVDNVEYFTSAARSFLASVEAEVGIKACAIVAKNRLAIILAKFFLIFNRNERKLCQLFSTEEKALKWFKGLSKKKKS
jgi:hypothetical protein